jgi:hypothetical protein
MRLFLLFNSNLHAPVRLLMTNRGVIWNHRAGGAAHFADRVDLAGYVISFHVSFALDAMLSFAVGIGDDLAALAGGEDLCMTVIRNENGGFRRGGIAAHLHAGFTTARQKSQRKEAANYAHPEFRMHDKSFQICRGGIHVSLDTESEGKVTIKLPQ